MLSEKVDNLKKKCQSNRSMERERKILFEGQKCLSHASLFVHTSLKVFNSYLWYLDSGCSRHMTGDKTLFKTLKEKVEMINNGEGPSIKEPDVEVEALNIEVEGSTPLEEAIPMNSRMETRSMSRTSSLLTPLEIHPPISRNNEASTLKKPSSRVIKNHPDSNIIGSLDEGLRLSKGNILLANHVTYHCYLAQF